MQELLLDAFNLMENFIFFTDSQAPSLSEGLLRAKFDVQAMSGSEYVVKEIQVKGLATFTAFQNKAIKVVFDDRTIVRMQ